MWLDTPGIIGLPIWAESNNANVQDWASVKDRKDRRIDDNLGDKSTLRIAPVFFFGSFSGNRAFLGTFEWFKISTSLRSSLMFVRQNRLTDYD